MRRYAFSRPTPWEQIAARVVAAVLVTAAILGAVIGRLTP